MAATYTLLGKTYTPEQYLSMLAERGVAPDQVYGGPGMSAEFTKAITASRNAASTLDPKAASDFNDYVKGRYGDYTPSWLKEASAAAKAGKGMTTWDLNQAVLTDSQTAGQSKAHMAELEKAGIKLPTVNRAFAAPVAADDAFAKAGVTKPTDAQYDQLSGVGSYDNRAIDYANESLILNGVNPGTSAFQQNLDFQTSDGVFAPDPTMDFGVAGQLLGVLAGAASGNPFLGAMLGGIGGADKGLFSALQGAAAGYGAGGGFDPLKAKVTDALGFGDKGFVNAGGLGLTGSNLSLPGLTNATAATPVAGYGASALNLVGNNLSLPALLNAPAATPVRGYGADAVGGDPKSLFSSDALGEKTTTKGSGNSTSLLGGGTQPAVAPRSGAVGGGSAASGPGTQGRGAGAPPVDGAGFGGEIRKKRLMDGAVRPMGRTSLLGG